MEPVGYRVRVRVRVFRYRCDPLALPENIFYVRYRFSSVPVGPYAGSADSGSACLVTER